MQWPEFYFARHGETSWNAERRYQGTRDIPLNARGQRQADAVGPLLKFLLEEDGRDPSEFDWFASPLSRARETMERIRTAFDIELPPIRFDDRLKEISFGELEGKLHAELPPELATPPGKRDASYWYHRPPKGENYDDISQRLTSFHAELTKPAIIVAHGGILRTIRHLASGASHDEVINWPPPQGAIAHFIDGGMTIHHSRESNAQQA